jgi:hypothetical protein
MQFIVRGPDSNVAEFRDRLAGVVGAHRFRATESRPAGADNAPDNDAAVETASLPEVEMDVRIPAAAGLTAQWLRDKLRRIALWTDTAIVEMPDAPGESPAGPRAGQ